MRSFSYTPGAGLVIRFFYIRDTSFGEEFSLHS